MSQRSKAHTFLGDGSMARQASEFTLAVRKLFEETNGTITHAEARPKLVERGIAVARQLDDKSEDCSAFLTAVSQYQRPTTDDEFKAMANEIATSLGWTPARLKNVIAEYNIVKEFRAERNGFDVTKNSWLKAQGKSEIVRSKSRKPKDGLKAIVMPASDKPQPKHGVVAVARRKVGVSSYQEQMDALKYVEENGGIKEIKKQIGTLHAEAADLRENAAQLQDDANARELEANELQSKLQLLESLATQLKGAAAA
jgi:hypothetical protein